MKKIRRKKVRAYARGAKTLLEIAAFVAVSWWGWRTFPEIVRYVRMERM